MDTGMSDAGACAAFGDDLAQLALGTLSGRERANVIDHVQGCVECAAELEGLSIAADALLLLAPEATPPNGFDQRVLSAMAQGRERHRPLSRRIMAVAAIALVALGVGIGSVVTRPAGHDPTFVSAALTSSSGAKGDVIMSWGAQSWMFMTVDDLDVAGSITCTVTLKNGALSTVGQFTIHQGYGAWAVWLKVPASDVRSVAVKDHAGVTIASAAIAV